MSENEYHPYGSLSQPTYEGCTFPSLQLNLEGGKLFCPTERKGSYECPGYCHKHHFSW